MTTSSTNPAAKYLADDWRAHTDGISQEEWRSDGQQFGRAYRKILLAIARWLVAGERQWGEMYDDAVVFTGLSYSRLTKLARVGNLLSILPLRQNLHISHYEALLEGGLEDDDRALLLDRAESEKLTAVAFGKVVKEFKRLRAIPDTPKPSFIAGLATGADDDGLPIPPDSVKARAQAAGRAIAEQLPKRPVVESVKDDSADVLGESGVVSGSTEEESASMDSGITQAFERAGALETDADVAPAFPVGTVFELVDGEVGGGESGGEPVSAGDMLLIEYDALCESFSVLAKDYEASKADVERLRDTLASYADSGAGKLSQEVEDLKKKLAGNILPIPDDLWGGMKAELAERKKKAKGMDATLDEGDALEMIGLLALRAGLKRFKADWGRQR